MPNLPNTSKNQKLLLICNTDGALFVFRQPIIKHALNLGYSVITLSGASSYIDGLKKLGAKTIAIPFGRHSTGIVSNAILLLRIAKNIRATRPDIVHSFTHKPAVYGTLISKLLNVKGIFVTITGLGTLFVNNDVRSRLLKQFLLLQYRVALKCADKVFFQNPDDLNLFVEKKVIRRDKCVLTAGSGIDLSDYKLPTEARIISARSYVEKEIGQSLAGKILVLLPSRVVKEKGVFEFYKAARHFSANSNQKLVFVHVGLFDHDANPKMSEEEFRRLAESCNVYFLGHKKNIDDYMIASDAVALPSYREGTPRSLIEALAYGKFIITSNAPGCREVIDEGRNGLLCETGSVKSLVSAFDSLTAKGCREVESASRNFCERKFDCRKLVQTTFLHYQQR